jgi:hypothetical protein
MQRINETKSWLCVKINKIDKPLANLTRSGGGKRPKLIKLEMKIPMKSRISLRGYSKSYMQVKLKI